MSSRSDCILKFTSCDSQALVGCIPIAGQSSHKMYSNNIVNFQESTTSLNACTKKSGNLLNEPGDGIGRLYVSRKEGGKGLPELKVVWIICTNIRGRL